MAMQGIGKKVSREVLLLFVAVLPVLAVFMYSLPPTSFSIAFSFLFKFVLAVWLGVYCVTFFDSSEYTPRVLSVDGWGKDAKIASFWLKHLKKTSVLYEDKETLKSLGQHILAVHPHGIFSFNHFLISSGAMETDSVLHPLSRRGLAASVMFRIPILREMALAYNWVDACRETAELCLDSGLSLSVIPGGEREMIMSEPGREFTVIKNRKGFVRLALKQGIPIVPVYSFGENDLFENPKFLWDTRSYIQRKFGVAITFAHSWRTFNFFGFKISIPLILIPYFDRQHTIVFGSPIYPPTRNTNKETANKEISSREISVEEVDTFHEIYVNELKKLFKKFSVELGRGAAELEIL